MPRRTSSSRQVPELAHGPAGRPPGQPNLSVYRFGGRLTSQQLPVGVDYSKCRDDVPHIDKNLTTFYRGSLGENDVEEPSFHALALCWRILGSANEVYAACTGSFADRANSRAVAASKRLIGNIEEVPGERSRTLCGSRSCLRGHLRHLWRRRRARQRRERLGLRIRAAAGECRHEQHRRHRPPHHHGGRITGDRHIAHRPCGWRSCPALHPQVVRLALHRSRTKINRRNAVASRPGAC
jgi:hypothetical protein